MSRANVDPDNVLNRKADAIRERLDEMNNRVAIAGRASFSAPGTWETCFSALVLVLRPAVQIDAILEALPYKPDALDKSDVLNAIGHLGYFGRSLTDAAQEIDTRLLPALLVDPDGHPTILIGRDADGQMLTFDPSDQSVAKLAPDQQILGRVWVFQRFDENRQQTSRFQRRGSGHSWFRAMCGRFKGTLSQVMLLGLFLNLISIAPPIYIMLVYDRVISANAIGVLPMLCVGAAGAVLFDLLFRAIRGFGLSWISGRMDHIVGNRIFSHLVSLPPGLIEKASVSSQISRIKTFEAVRDFFSSSVFVSVLDAPFVILSLAAMYFIAGPLALVPVAIVLCYIVLFWFMRQQVKSSIRISAKASSARQQFTIDTFEKLETIRLHGLSEKWERKFRDLSGREMMAHFRLGFQGAAAETGAHALTVIAAMLTLSFGVQSVWDGSLSPGGLVAAMILTWRVLTPFYSLCAMIPRLEQLRNSIIQINDLMEVKTEAEEAIGFARLPRLRGAISFDNVMFRYGGEGELIFRDLTFDVRPGEFVALTGPNGSGKATVLKLIQALHRATTGAVRIDGFDVRQLNAPDLRKRVAYVPKDPTFFDGTILENLRIGDGTATEADVRKALDLADALTTVEAMPDGLMTRMGRGGGEDLNSTLLARLSLARAFVRRAPVLLIDELPNSLLSGRLGQNLKSYFERARGKQTIVMCTYREDFIQLADSLVILRGLSAPEVRRRAHLTDQLLNSSTKVA